MRGLFSFFSLTGVVHGRRFTSGEHEEQPYFCKQFRQRCWKYTKATVRLRNTKNSVSKVRSSDNRSCKDMLIYAQHFSSAWKISPLWERVSHWLCQAKESRPFETPLSERFNPPSSFQRWSLSRLSVFCQSMTDSGYSNNVSRDNVKVTTLKMRPFHNKKDLDLLGASLHLCRLLVCFGLDDR